MQNLNNGLYLILDPAMDYARIIRQLSAALEEPISAIQIWDNFPPERHPGELLELVLETIGENPVPLLINNRWELLKDYALHGVHFDFPPDLENIRNALGRSFISGLTCNNDLEIIHQAETLHMDYISFCSIFPSQTANSCELVDFRNIQAASKHFSGKIFLSGGIHPGNIHQLEGLPYDGIAVVSGVMQSPDPRKVIQTYAQQLSTQQ